MYIVQLQIQMSEVRFQDLQELRRTLPALPGQGPAGMQDACMCAPLIPLFPAPQSLLMLTALVVAAAFTGLGIKWAEEWRSARISLQVSHLNTRDSLPVPRSWPVEMS